MKEKQELDNTYNSGFTEGYKLGLKDGLKNKEKEALIGSALLDVLDNRYKRIEEDYE